MKTQSITYHTTRLSSGEKICAIIHEPMEGWMDINPFALGRNHRVELTVGQREAIYNELVELASRRTK